MILGNHDINARIYFADKDRFIDFSNAVAFNGKNVLTRENCYDFNSDAAARFGNIALDRRRDIIYHCIIENHDVLIGLENQTRLDKTMPIRDATYDLAVYNRLLGPNREIENLIPVYSKVINWGEKRWGNQYRRLNQLLKIPGILNEEANEWEIEIVDIIDLDYHDFKNRDNYMLVKTIQLVYRYKGNDEMLKGLILPKDALEIVASLADDETLKKIMEENSKVSKGGEVEMCESIKEFRRQVHNKAKAEGISEGISLGRTEGKSESGAEILLMMLSKKMEITEKIKETVNKSSYEMMLNALANIDQINDPNDLDKLLIH
ncbi:MAG: hypothetical protein ACLRT4_11095 [Thomasclavelia sp.]